MDLSDLHIDTQRAEAGVWQDYGDGKLLVARIGSPKWDARRAELITQHREDLRRAADDRDDDRSRSIITEIHTKLLAELCLKGWENVRYGTRALTYSTELAERLMHEIPLFREEVWSRAWQLAPYKLDLDEDAIKNLLASSNGNMIGGSTKSGPENSTSSPIGTALDSTTT